MQLLFVTICSVCRHENADAIAGALLAGDSVRSVAERYGLSKSAVHRHTATCLGEQLAEARAQGKRVSTAALVDRLRDVTTETRELLEQAREAGDVALALKAIGRLEGQLRMEGELGGELDVPGTSHTAVSLEFNPEWVSMRALIVEALGPHPRAKLAVVQAISGPRQPIA